MSKVEVLGTQYRWCLKYEDFHPDNPLGYYSDDSYGYLSEAQEALVEAPDGVYIDQVMTLEIGGDMPIEALKWWAKEFECVLLSMTGEEI